MIVSKKMRFASRLKKAKKLRISRSEIYEPKTHSHNRRELEGWFLRTGISPVSQLPVSYIGIYTDFT